MWAGTAFGAVVVGGESRGVGSWIQAAGKGDHVRVSVGRGAYIPSPGWARPCCSDHLHSVITRVEVRCCAPVIRIRFDQALEGGVVRTKTLRVRVIRGLSAERFEDSDPLGPGKTASKGRVWVFLSVVPGAGWESGGSGTVRCVSRWRREGSGALGGEAAVGIVVVTPRMARSGRGVFRWRRKRGSDRDESTSKKSAVKMPAACDFQ